MWAVWTILLWWNQLLGACWYAGMVFGLAGCQALTYMMADSLLVGRVLFCHGCLWSPECPRAAGNTLSGRATFSCGSWLLILESAGIGTGLLVDSYAPDDNRLEGALQNVACKHQCLCGRKSFKKKWLIPVSPSPKGVSFASYLSRSLSRLAGCLTQALTKLLPLSWDSACEILPLKAKSFFP